jgi:coenzyme F420-0:L-glutamate ligase/coenzyme F420-1:gamma-L-glutamate ligase
VARRIEVFPISGIPEVREGDDLGAIVAEAALQSGTPICADDVVVVAQKIVSKAEGAIVQLRSVSPSPRAAAWAAAHGKDPALVELVLRESARIIRMERGVIIAETRHGFVCANAGVDTSNVGDNCATLLPLDPDASAARLGQALSRRFGVNVAVIVADSFGRPWREGIVNVALGVAGLAPLDDLRGRCDGSGRPLHSTIVAVADEIAAAAELVMTKSARIPAAVVRGAGEWIGKGTARSLIRRADQDMFR